MKATIRQNAWDNWYGYLGGKKVIAFGNAKGQTAERAANEWLAQQSAPKLGRPFTVHANHAVTFRLDVTTIEGIDGLSKRWKCSKAEVVRRMVAEQVAK